MSIISRSLILFLVFQLSGCAFGWLKTTKKGENTEGWTVTQFYEQGKQDMEDGDWKSAISFFIAGSSLPIWPLCPASPTLCGLLSL